MSTSSTWPNADWRQLVAYLSGDATPAEVGRIEAWIGEHPERQLATNQLRAAWDLPRNPARANDESSKLAIALDGARRAVLASVRSEASNSPAQSAPAQSARARKLPLTRRQPDPERNNGWRGAAALGIALCVGIGALAIGTTGTQTERAARLSSATNVQQTPRGQRATLELPDGSRVVLAPDSRISYQKGPNTREVTLSGEALFTVARYDGQPFTVHAGASTTRVLGTSFTVRSYPGDSLTRVVVAEGRVSTGNTILSTGDVGTVTPNGGVRVTHVASVTAMIAWAQGRLVFDDVPLREVVPALERWFDVKIDYDKASLGDRTLTATFSDQSAGEVADFIAFSLGVEARRDGRHITLIPR